MILPIKDINGNDIHDGDEILFNGQNFIVMHIDKDHTEWVLHPCGNNQLMNIIEIASIPTPIDTTIKFELVKH